MIVYHGTPFGIPRDMVLRVCAYRHLLISYAISNRAWRTWTEVCASFVIDNGAFTAWKQGQEFCLDGFYAFAEEALDQPHCSWALAPDVIDGDEDANDHLLRSMPVWFRYRAVPVWHMHESLLRLERLCGEYQLVAIGSSGRYEPPGCDVWFSRMHEAWTIVDNFRTRIHGLRMAHPRIVQRLPFASVDSSNAARNGGNETHYNGPLAGCSVETRTRVLAENLELCPKARSYDRPKQNDLFANLEARP